VKKVRRSEIPDLATYEKIRDGVRREILEVKRPRRVHVGEHLTLLFENHATVRYQVLEMIRAERIVREEDVRHELETYNELLGGKGQLGCTLLIEIDDPAERAGKLSSWIDLPERFYLLLDDGTKVRPGFDERQRGKDRLSSVQYLCFDVGHRTPVAAGVDRDDLRVETKLTDEQRAALAQDLSAD
jgi:hypothetical protein